MAIEGTYAYGSWEKTVWAEGNPDPLTPPSYVKMTLTDNNGLTYSAEESNLHTIYSAGGDWASLWGIDHIVTDQSELDAAIVQGGYIYITAENNTLTLGKNMKIGEDTVIDLAGSTQYIKESIKAESGRNLTMKNGTVVKKTTYGKVRFDTNKDTSDNQTVMFENITFSNIEAFSSTGSSSNATDNMIQIVPREGKGTYTFKNCIFENAYVDIDGLSGVEPGDIEVNFENCKFNNWGNANVIQIGAYTKGKVSVTSSTFDIESTSNVSIVSNKSANTTVSISNSSVNGVKVEANESEGIKVFSNQSVKLGNVDTETGITYSGSAEGFYVGK